MDKLSRFTKKFTTKLISMENRQPTYCYDQIFSITQVGWVVVGWQYIQKQCLNSNLMGRTQISHIMSPIPLLSTCTFYLTMGVFCRTINYVGI